MRLRKVFFIIFILFDLVLVAYFLGPTPKVGTLDTSLPKVPSNLLELEKDIAQKEAQHSSLKKNNEARIIWANPNKKEKTEYSVVYIHGFTASQGEGAPVHQKFAQKFGCNLYLARLAGHGLDTTEALLDATPERLLESATRAVAIGKQIGEKVIIMSTSTGSTLALLVAADNPDLAALILYSPLIDFADSSTFLLDKPWGLQITRTIFGGKYLGRQDRDSEFNQYWTNKYRIEPLLALKALLSQKMNAETFQKIKIPTFLGYYYKDEENQDPTISVAAAQNMFQELGTAENQKVEKAFPKAEAHVLTSPLTSKDIDGVLNTTIDFAKDILKMKPIRP